MKKYNMRNFWFYRNEDVSGISGTGYVAEGVVFSSGKVAISFFPVAPTFVSNVINFSSMDDVEKIHGHDGKTEIHWELKSKIEEKGEG
jgi:hypothetical protein